MKCRHIWSFCTIQPGDYGSSSTIAFTVNGKHIICPKFVEVNGNLEPESYEIQEGDQIETRSFYTVEQVAEFMEIGRAHV